MMLEVRHHVTISHVPPFLPRSVFCSAPLSRRDDIITASVGIMIQCAHYFIQVSSAIFVPPSSRSSPPLYPAPPHQMCFLCFMRLISCCVPVFEPHVVVSLLLCVCVGSKTGRCSSVFTETSLHLKQEP